MIKFFQNIDEILQWVFNKFDEKKFLKSVFKKKKITFVDIGTNYGSFYFQISNFLNIKKALLIDPYPKIKRDLGKEISIIEMALTNKKTVRNFYQHNISSHSSFYKRNNKLNLLSGIKKKTLVKCDSLDNIFFENDLKYIDLLKIDAQHEEYKILEGSYKILKKKLVNVIKIEINTISFYKKKKSNFYEIISILNKYNYKLFNISKIKYINNEIALIDAYFKKN